MRVEGTNIKQVRSEWQVIAISLPFKFGMELTALSNDLLAAIIANPSRVLTAVTPTTLFIGPAKGQNV